MESCRRLTACRRIPTASCRFWIASCVSGDVQACVGVDVPGSVGMCFLAPTSGMAGMAGDGFLGDGVFGS